MNRKARTPATGSQREVHRHGSLQATPHNLHSAEAAHRLTTPTRVKKRQATSPTSEIPEVRRTHAMAIARSTQEKPQDLARPPMKAKTFPTIKMMNKNK